MVQFYIENRDPAVLTHEDELSYFREAPICSSPDHRITVKFTSEYLENPYQLENSPLQENPVQSHIPEQEHDGSGEDETKESAPALWPDIFCKEGESKSDTQSLFRLDEKHLDTISEISVTNMDSHI